MMKQTAFFLSLVFIGLTTSETVPKPSSTDVGILPLEKANENDKIIGGSNAEVGEFPYQVSLEYVDHYGAEHICGGSIMDKFWVITAAHCCIGYTAGNIQVIAGGIQLEVLEAVEQRRDLKRIIVHEDYAYPSYDICILELAEPFEFNEYVQPIELPGAMDEVPVGTKAIVSGWGSTGKVTVPVISDEECQKAYLNGHTILGSMLCAGLPEGGKDACQGDSGGPLVDNKSKTLIGIISWGDGCGRPGKPGVYTQVSHFVEWIDRTVGKN